MKTSTSRFISGFVSMDEVHIACHDAENGLPSRRPVIEMTIPSTLDNTISPPGTLILFFLVCLVIRMHFSSECGFVL